MKSIITHGYVEDRHGFSGPFSWWRNTLDWRFWSVCGHGPFCQSGCAVTDDFGNLVAV
jgi:hypothetical protein